MHPESNTDCGWYAIVVWKEKDIPVAVLFIFLSIIFKAKRASLLHHFQNLCNKGGEAFMNNSHNVQKYEMITWISLLKTQPRTWFGSGPNYIQSHWVGIEYGLGLYVNMCNTWVDSLSTLIMWWVIITAGENVFLRQEREHQLKCSGKMYLVVHHTAAVLVFSLFGSLQVDRILDRL